jgi:hypothetical protein
MPSNPIAEREVKSLEEVLVNFSQKLLAQLLSFDHATAS